VLNVLFLSYNSYMFVCLFFNTKDHVGNKCLHFIMLSFGLWLSVQSIINQIKSKSKFNYFSLENVK